MDQEQIRKLSARVVIWGLAALVVFYMLPGGDSSQITRTTQAMRNARSWRVQTEIHEPARDASALTEVYCPGKLHTVTRSTTGTNGEFPQSQGETLAVDGTSYTRTEAGWIKEPGFRTIQTPAVCQYGPAGSDLQLSQLDAIRSSGQFRKESKRKVNGEKCRDWVASIPAPAGWRELFTVCIGKDDLPREIYTPGRKMVTTYSAWNSAIVIDAPPAEDIVAAPTPTPWQSDSSY